MSSAADSLKQAATEAAKDEPSQKRVKTDQTNSTTLEADNGTTAKSDPGSGKEEAVEPSSNNNNNYNDVKNKTVPSKAVNGSQEKGSSLETSSEGLDDYDEDNEGADLGAFDPRIAGKLEQVEHIQNEICNLNEKASEEILKVEQKFNKLRRPHFEKRNELLKEIPNFWLTSLANHPLIAPMIESAEDEDCLHYMVNLDIEEFEDIKSGYKLKLHFIDNPYITNQVITKEFQMLGSEEASSPTTLKEPIVYKDTQRGQSLKRIVEASIAASRRSSRTLGQVQQSFFAWLTESGTDDVAEILKDQIWPNPLEFFFATPPEYDEADDDESDDDDDEDIEDEDLDDEENPDDQDLENIGVDFEDELEDDDEEGGGEGEEGDYEEEEE